jgi:penicillin-insensitive murein endopeptidase
MPRHGKLSLLLAPLVVAGCLVCASVADAKSRVHHGTQSHHARTVSKDKKKRSPDAIKLFAAKKLPADLPQSSVGFYANGCLAGASKLPLSGPHWQVMHPSRNRFWGRDDLIDYIKDLSDRAFKDGWNGLLVADMGEPRGGPMPSGHDSHQVGLDVDIWLWPAPDHPLTDEEREHLPDASVLEDNSVQLDTNKWTPEHAAFVRDAAQDARVARIFVTPAIKKNLCDNKKADGSDADWLSKLRPWVGHDRHIHVRLHCPKGDNACQEQDAPPVDGCGAEVDDALAHTQKESSDNIPDPPRDPVPLSHLPAACVGVLNAPDKKVP